MRIISPTCLFPHISNRQASAHLYVAGAIRSRGASSQLPCQGSIQEQSVAGERPRLGADGDHVPLSIVGVRLQDMSLLGSLSPSTEIERQSKQRSLKTFGVEYTLA